MLQQTQIATGLPYYERWMKRFPTVQDLASASEPEAMALWQGLGYYRRCRMLLQAAKTIAETGMPTNHEGWLKVPGVGRYTAAAISSICYGEPCAVVDGNVERVYARLTCDPATGSKLKSNTWIWADNHLYKENPGDWNQAVMELGATVCKPTQPLCKQCPISHECVAYQTNQGSNYPKPKLKPKVVKYQEEILIPIFGENIGIQIDHELDWWKGLSLLPLSSTFPKLAENLWKESLGEVRYTVTNHRITALVSYFRVENPVEQLTWIHRDKIDEVPLPAPHRKALKLLYKT